MGDVLLHHRGIDRDPLKIAVLHQSRTLPGLNRLGQHPLDPFFSDPLAPARQGRRVNRQAMLKECLAAEMLPVRVLGPAGHDGLVRKRKGMLKVAQTGDQTWRCRGTAGVRWKEPEPFPLENIPVDQDFQLY